MGKVGRMEREVRFLRDGERRTLSACEEDRSGRRGE